jgi:hypothetical protein
MEFKKKQPESREPEREMGHEDYWAVAAKVATFVPTSGYAPYRWQEFLAHCGAGALDRFTYANGHERLSCAMMPGSYQLWLARIRHYERSGGTYPWAEKPEAATVSAISTQHEEAVDNPFDFLSN